MRFERFSEFATFDFHAVFQNAQVRRQAFLFTNQRVHRAVTKIICGNNTARSLCLCGNNTARSLCLCGNNTSRSFCLCGNNTGRSLFRLSIQSRECMADRSFLSHSFFFLFFQTCGTLSGPISVFQKISV